MVSLIFITVFCYFFRVQEYSVSPQGVAALTTPQTLLRHMESHSIHCIASGGQSPNFKFFFVAQKAEESSSFLVECIINTSSSKAQIKIKADDQSASEAFASLFQSALSNFGSSWVSSCNDLPFGQFLQWFLCVENEDEQGEVIIDTQFIYFWSVVDRCIIRFVDESGFFPHPVVVLYQLIPTSLNIYPSTNLFGPETLIIHFFCCLFPLNFLLQCCTFTCRNWCMMNLQVAAVGLISWVWPLMSLNWMDAQVYTQFSYKFILSLYIIIILEKPLNFIKTILYASIRLFGFMQIRDYMLSNMKYRIFSSLGKYKPIRASKQPV